MGLRDKLYHLNFDDDEFEIGDDGQGGGPQIERWNSNRPQPNAAQLAAVTQQQERAARRGKTFQARFETDKKDEALIQWIADLSGMTLAQAKQEIKDIWDQIT